MKIGIVDLPNVGKSTLFNALTKAGAEASNLELILADLELVEKRIATESKKAKGQDKEARENQSRARTGATGMDS